jgi:hypothetical protein
MTEAIVDCPEQGEDQVGVGAVTGRGCEGVDCVVGLWNVAVEAGGTMDPVQESDLIPFPPVPHGHKAELPAVVGHVVCCLGWFLDEAAGAVALLYLTCWIMSAILRFLELSTCAW